MMLCFIGILQQHTGPCTIVAGPIYPLPSEPPLRTVRPLCLEAAWACVDTPGTLTLRVVAWTLHSGGASTKDAAAPCTIHALTLRCCVRGWDVHLDKEACVQTSSLAPFAVALDGKQGRLALATCALHDAPGADQWGGRGDDDDDVDPRTLEQAAQRLAQFTCEEAEQGAWTLLMDTVMTRCIKQVVGCAKTNGPICTERTMTLTHTPHVG